MNFSINKKILIGFTVCSLILLAVASASFKNSEQFLDTNKWINHTYDVLYEFDQILINSVDAETGTRGFVITGVESYLEPYNSSKIGITTHIKNARKLTVDNPTQQKNIDDIEALLQKRVSYLESCIEARKNKSFEEAKTIIDTGEGKRLQDEVRQIVIRAKGIEQALLIDRKNTSEIDAKDFSVIFISLLLVIVAVLVIVYFIITANLKALKKSQDDSNNKNWTLTGTSELVKIMQGNKHIIELSQIIINYLNAYLNTQTGALYLLSPDNKLTLASGYALSRKVSVAPTVKIGEGIVGQAAAENRTILLRGITSDLFTVNSSFGEVTLKNIIAVPFSYEDAVIGVIELGTMHEFSELQKNYLQIISDGIAIALISAQSREKTKELLEETQRQSEELTAQQEELRQSNEELHAKTQLLEMSEKTLRAQQEELKQSNEELGKRTDSLEEQKEKLEFAKAEIENKAEEIQTTSKYKSEFLANMSHELRTPLNSILILAQLIAENKNNTLGVREVEFAKNIHTSGNDLLTLINEILDLSKVESGKMQLDITETSLQSILNNTSALFAELAKSKSINFFIDVKEKIKSSLLTTDQQRVEQILRNLLSNAFKFTDKGGTITLKVTESSADALFNRINVNGKSGYLAFSVSDTGIGIPENKRAIIFEAFQQADGSTKRKYGGTGLGLSISRELAFALGGEIKVESEEGSGSTFTLSLPMQFDPSEIIPINRQIEIKERDPDLVKEKTTSLTLKEPIQEATHIDDRNNIQANDKIILIIEDEEHFAKILLEFVHERNCKGIIALQGGTGLSFARHYKPAAIFLDMKLPVMSGEDILKQIKNDPDLRHIPIQVISAFDRKKIGMQLGAFDYLIKPITTTDLKNAFNRIEMFASKRMKKLLVIEDNEQQNNAIKELIGNGDVKCYSALTGKEAFKMLEEDNFDCVILDLGLPDISGFELLEKLKVKERINKIPVIVYTGKDLSKEDNAKLNKLADTVVLKTANSHERLLDETTLFLHRMETRLPQEKQNLIRKLHNYDEVLKDKKILLVDDDMRNIYSITNALEEEGLSCIVADNGKAAIEALKNDPTIDLVLMDIMMPEMDGYEATIEIRKISTFGKLPIIALTAKAMKGDKEKCLAVGMSDYISKPVDISKLVALMRVWLYR
jgi:CheY-like chemotaxis protein/CHASE3 domain sensor protein